MIAHLLGAFQRALDVIELTLTQTCSRQANEEEEEEKEGKEEGKEGEEKEGEEGVEEDRKERKSERKARKRDRGPISKRIMNFMNLPTYPPTYLSAHKVSCSPQIVSV